ncbi:MAG: hypothetical protein L0170_12700 [Acidobacteria bacterium]|nr:hypothetical protein [Acidobacteriota bacterium]
MSTCNDWIHEYAVLDAWGEKIQDRKTELRRLIQEWMEDRELKNVSTEAGSGAFFRETKIRASVSPEDTEALHAWLQETGNGGVVKPTVHHATLSAVVGELVARGDAIPAFIKTYEDRGFTIRKGRIEIPDLPNVTEEWNHE